VKGKIKFAPTAPKKAEPTKGKTMTKIEMERMRAAFAILALGSVFFLCGCGEGPKHLPKGDYQHGKAAFQMLERYEIAFPSGVEASSSYLLSAAEQMDAIPANHENAGMRDGLQNYQDAIQMAVSVRLLADQAQLTQGATEKTFGLRRANYELAPILRLCHDDAAQYFDASAASTGSCKAQLEVFHAKHPDVK
jgi:hypothetical protein